MIVVFIDWYIKPDKVDEFLEYWKTKLQIKDKDRSGLIGEFLSDPADIQTKQWITWNMQAGIPADSSVHDSPPYKRFVNVGLWMNETSFEAAVGANFNKPGGILEFEAKPRRRALLIPEEWRRGGGSLPEDDSKGVL